MNWQQSPRKHNDGGSKDAPLIVNIVTQMEAGGAQKAAIQLCEHFIKKGFRSEVWFLYKKRPTYESYPYVRWIYKKRPDKPSELFRLIRVLRQLMIEAQPAGIITYTHYANIIGQLTAWSAGIRYRLSTQRNPSWSYPIIARICDGLLGTFGIYTANIYASETVSHSFDYYPLAYRKRSRTVINRLTRLIPNMTKAEARRKFGLPQEAFIVVSVGRISLQKNHEILVRAMTEIKDDTVILAIAGDGELRCQLHTSIIKSGLVNRVFLLGELLPSQIPDFLISGDVAAFPSRYEAFGFALVESMMMGLPVIASDIDAHREVAGSGAILLPLDDPRAWAAGISRLARDPSLRLELSARAQEKAKEYSNIEVMVNGYLQALFGTDEPLLVRRTG